MTKKITLEVPKEFNFTPRTPDENKMILTLGSELLNHSKAKLSTDDYSKQMQHIYDDILGATKSVVHSMKETNSNDRVAILTNALNDCKAERARSDLVFTSMREEYIKTIQRLEDQIKRAEERNTSLDKLFSQNAAVKGKAGEQTLTSILASMFPNVEIISTAKTTAACDMVLVLPRFGREFRIMIESKNVANVSAVDVNKFIRDCELASKDKKADGALFVSLFSDNIPKKGSYSFETIGNLPIVYLASGMQNPESMKLAIESLIFANTKMSADEKKQPQENFDDVKAAISSANQSLIKQRDRITAMKKNISVVLDGLTAMGDEATATVAIIEKMWEKHPSFKIHLQNANANATTNAISPTLLDAYKSINAFIETNNRDPTKDEILKVCKVPVSTLNKNGGARGLIAGAKNE
jgi:hypothetical protein